MMQGGWHHGGFFLGMHALWWGFWILVLVAVGWGFWRAGGRRRSAWEDAEDVEAAEEILRRRFAAGEIDEEELRRRLRVLEDSWFGD